MNGAAPAIDTRLRPLVAMRAVRALLRNPNDTSQIFVIFRALRGRSGINAYRRFTASATGQRVLAERRDLLPRLEDRAALAALPDGSVGRAYLAFMEQENLSADGLVMASPQGDPETMLPDPARFRDRMRDAHDLTHILTGYGRDPLGELCLLAFMNRHTSNLGQLLIIAMSWKRLPRPARAAVRQAWRQGIAPHWFPGLDFEALLPRPLDAVRRELGVPAPTRYSAIVP
jgi:ubiquinone biosynthesis protein COQ4